MAEINNLVVAEKSDLVAIANAIRAKSGSNESLSFPMGFVDGITGIVGEDTGVNFDGLENGYDVTFYDEHGEELAFYSVKKGHSVDAPNYECVAWVTEEGQKIVFPYVPTSDISLYANNDTYASQLYKYYGLDPAIYPYLIITHAGTNIGNNDHVDVSITFAKSYSWIPSIEQMEFETVFNTYSGDYTPDEWSDDIPTFVSQIMERIPPTSLKSKQYAYVAFRESERKYSAKAYSNFEITLTHRILYRLNYVEIENEEKQEFLLQEKTVTENGEVIPDEGYDGLSKVIVDVKSSDTLEGLVNGYDVMFYDENNEALAFYSIKSGHSIEAPIYNCKSWQTQDGLVITFPYTPTGDLILYAVSGGYVDILYEHFGQDKATYPYVCLSYYFAGHPIVQVSFATTVTVVKSTRIGLSNGVQYSCGDEDLPVLSDDENYLAKLIEVATTRTFTSSNYSAGFPTINHDGTNGSLPCYVNYEQTDTNYATCRYLE